MSPQTATLLPTPTHRPIDHVCHQPNVSRRNEVAFEARILTERSCLNERTEDASPFSSTAHGMCGPWLEHAPGGYESCPEQESYCLCGHCSYDTPSLPPQSVDYLSVPPRRDEGIIKAVYLWREDEAECNPVLREAPRGSSSSDRTDLFEQPIRVFSLSHFRRTVDEAARERLVFYHVLPAIHRWYYRLVAMHASAVATSFRARWDSDLFCWQIERPFKWTDSAEPLLSQYCYDPNALILDSVDPLLTPHIVIHEAPEQDLRTLENISIPPQWCYYGYFLTHPFGCSGSCCNHHAYS
ncbi:uncharacterized protein PHACADRAFT_169800, partial [Phanerochaete carnosa HHB-10118-sp]